MHPSRMAQLIGTVAAAWEAPLFIDLLRWHRLPANGRSLSSVTGSATLARPAPDGGSAVAVLKNSKHPKEAMEFLDWFNTQVPDLVSQGLVRGCYH